MAFEISLKLTNYWGNNSYFFMKYYEILWNQIVKYRPTLRFLNIQ